MSLWWSSRVVAWVWWVLVARTAAVVGRSTLGMQPAQDVRPDQETMNYLLPRLADNFAPGPWQQVMDPRLYVLSELEAQIENTLESDRSKREGLSIEDGKNVLRKLHEHRLWEQRRKSNRDDITNAGKRSVVAADYFDDNDASDDCQLRQQLRSKKRVATSHF